MQTMTGLYGFETADSKDTKVRFVLIVFLERLIVLRVAVPRKFLFAEASKGLRSIAVEVVAGAWKS